MCSSQSAAAADWPPMGDDVVEVQDDMTLVIGGVARDGTFLVTDSCETVRDKANGLTSVRGDQPKILRVAGFALGVAGPGAWARPLVAALGARSYENVGAFAEAAHRAAVEMRNLPPFCALCAGPDGMCLLQGDQGTPTSWRTPISLREDKWRCIGVPHLANWIIKTLWTDDLTVDDAVAVALVAMRASADVFPNVAPPFQLFCCRASGAPWEKDDEDRARLAADAWLPYARSYPWGG